MQTDENSERAGNRAGNPELGPLAYAGWILYLFFRPAVFFRTFFTRRTMLLTILAGLAFGIARSHSRIEGRVAVGRAGFIPDEWLRYWGMLIAFGIIGGALYYLIGGWWYHQRIKWSGETYAEIKTSRRIYLFAALVWTLPTLVGAAWQSANYATPFAAFTTTEPEWTDLLIIFPFWSIIVSFIGVRTVCKVRLLPTLIWFIILPTSLYVGVFALAIVLFMSEVAAR